MQSRKELMPATTTLDAHDFQSKMHTWSQVFSMMYADSDSETKLSPTGLLLAFCTQNANHSTPKLPKI